MINATKSQSLNGLIKKFLILEIEFKIDIPDSVSIMGDFYSIEEIFLNLILNSCQAFKNTLNPVIKVSAYIQDKNTGLAVSVVTITDNGPGVCTKDLERIFEPFYSTKLSGTGLGLYVVKELVRRNGAQIKVESKAGVTTFGLEFPR